MIHRNLKHIVVSLATGGMLVVVLFLLLNGTSLTARAAPGDLFVIPAGSGDCSQGNPCALQTALDQAVDGDNLYLAQGTYTGSGGAVITLTKSFGLYGGWDGSTSMPVTRNPNTYPSILNGEDARRVININATITPTIDGFVITGGKSWDGGGIYINHASPIIQNNVITNNRTIDGGSYEDGRGGGIYVVNDSQAVISHNKIFSNTSGYGGGIYHNTYTEMTVTISMNEIIGNMASHRAGGIDLSDATDIVQGNIISGNTAASNAGGMLIWDSDALVEGNYIMNNMADKGGGIFIGNGSSPTLYSNLLVNNKVDGIYVNQSFPVIVNNTIIAQTTNSGSGLLLDSPSDCDPDYCTKGSYINNIIIKYQYGISGIGSITPTIDYNDVWGNSIDNYDLPMDVVTGTHNISINPSFVNTMINNYHIRPNSPCLNAGDPAGVPPAPSTDIDGQPRPADGRVDIGADEIGYSHFLPALLR